jgi:hypothetical protein
MNVYVSTEPILYDERGNYIQVADKVDVHFALL